jgi:hypothetical protein
MLRGRGSSRVGGGRARPGQATSVCPWSKKSSTINDEAESAGFSSPVSVRRTRDLRAFQFSRFHIRKMSPADDISGSQGRKECQGPTPPVSSYSKKRNPRCARLTTLSGTWTLHPAWAGSIRFHTCYARRWHNCESVL